MLIKDDRELLQKTAEHALAFILDHCDDVQLCNLAATLVQGMRELCDTEKQMPRQDVHVIDPGEIVFPPRRYSYPVYPAHDQNTKQEILHSLAAQTLGYPNATE